MTNRRIARPVALLLSLLLASPLASSLYGAEPAAALGRVVAAPPAALNGFAVPGDATLLNGDRLTTGANGWARVLLPGGEQIHLSAASNARAARQGDRVEVELTQGRVALRTHESESIVVRSNGLEIAPAADAVWEVARLDEGLTQVSAERGTLAIRGADRTVEVLSGQSLRLTTRLMETDDRQTPGAGSDAGMTQKTKTVIVLVVLGGVTTAIAVPLALEDEAAPMSPSGVP